MSSSQTAIELSINPHEQIHKSSLDTISILQWYSCDFVYVIGEDLELSFTQCFPRTIFHHLSSQYVWYVKYGPTEIFIKNEALQLQPIIMSDVHCLTLTLGMNDTTHFETLAQDTLHTNFICESHLYAIHFLISPDNHKVIIIGAMTKLSHVWRNLTYLCVPLIITLLNLTC
jgi:hypothetical protein